MKPEAIEKLPQYLQDRRWFSGKAWPIKSTQVAEYSELPGTDCALAIVEVNYEVGQPERYLLPVRISGTAEIQDALEEDRFARRFLSLLAGSGALPLGSDHVRGKLIGAPGLLDKLSPEPAVRRMGVEQSNTSIVFDEKVILKVIRKFEPGVNPEYEVGAFLHHAGFEGTPRFLGALELDGSHGGTLALAHEFLPNDGDGWAFVLKAFQASPSPSAEVLKELRSLGVLIAQLHLALASDGETLAFSPEPILQEDFQRWSSSITGELGVTLATASSIVPELVPHREALVARAHRLAEATPSGQKIRVHGDLHLGQVLRTAQGWRVFDFEGEPSRNFNQRREKHTALKDVAGMLRSFAYAAAAAEKSSGSPRESWLAPARESFLEGYLSTAGKAPFLPERPEPFRTVLEALEFEKLLYELRYELSNRPDWVQIPARALMAIATQR